MLSFFSAIPFAWCLTAFVLLCFVISCCASSSLYICSALLFLGLEEDWLWSPLGCLCATSGFCPQTPILKRLTESKVYLLNLPYPMPLIGLFNFVAGFAAEVDFFNWSNLQTTFALIYPSRCQILPLSPTLEIITRDFPKFSLINSTFRFWTIVIFFSRLSCSTSSSQLRGERRRSSICNRFYFRQQEGVS